jgi:hypothetical protein
MTTRWMVAIFVLLPAGALDAHERGTLFFGATATVQWYVLILPVTLYLTIF